MLRYKAIVYVNLLMFLALTSGCINPSTAKEENSGGTSPAEHVPKPPPIVNRISSANKSVVYHVSEYFISTDVTWTPLQIDSFTKQINVGGIEVSIPNAYINSGRGSCKGIRVTESPINLHDYLQVKYKTTPEDLNVKIGFSAIVSNKMATLIKTNCEMPEFREFILLVDNPHSASDEYFAPILFEQGGVIFGALPLPQI